MGQVVRNGSGVSARRGVAGQLDVDAFLPFQPGVILATLVRF